MALDVAAKVPSGTIKDSTLCGMSLDDFYKAMISVVFPGFTVFYAEDEIEYSQDDIASASYSVRISGVKRTYYIGNGLSDPIPIPEFTKDDQRFIASASFTPFSKNPLYTRAENLARYIRVVDAFVRIAARHNYRPATINGLLLWLKYKSETFSDLAVTIIKWLIAQIPIEDRNWFVDYLATEEHYRELYVELVQFIHKYLTKQDNTAKFEL